MISALDTSVLLDVFLPDARFLEGSRQAIADGHARGALVICEPVYAELAAQFASRDELDRILAESSIRVEPVSREAAFLAGRLFRRYRDSGGTRERIITDFLIGSHATMHATHLISRDRGFYRRYFENLTLLDPTESVT
jgi:hypothetical protein